MTTTYNFNQRAYSQPQPAPDNWYDDFTPMTQLSQSGKPRPTKPAQQNVSISKRTLAALALTTVGAGGALGLLAFNLAGETSEPTRATTVYPNYSVYPQLQAPTVTTPPATRTTVVDIPAAAPSAPINPAPVDPAPAAAEPAPAPVAEEPAPTTEPAPEETPKPQVIPIPIPVPASIPVPAPIPVPVPIPVPAPIQMPGPIQIPSGNGGQNGNPGGNGGQNQGGNVNQGGNANQGGQGAQSPAVPPVVNAPKPGE